MSIKEAPHKRYNILTGEWILVSPHRTKRPWQGKQESIPTDDRPSYDPDCYLCPGNKRANGEVNPHYSEPFSFTNDFALVKLQQPMYLTDNELKTMRIRIPKMRYKLTHEKWEIRCPNRWGQYGLSLWV